MNTGTLTSIETSRLKLNTKLNSNISARRKVFVIHKFIDLLFASNNFLLVESYLPEFIDSYKRLLDLFAPEGIDINLSYSIIEQVKKILQIQSLKNITGDLEKSLHLLEAKTLVIKNALDGIENDESTRKRFIFPLLSKNNDDENNSDGYLDTITVHLKLVNTVQKFFTIPDEIEKDELLNTQLNNSWLAATSFVKSKIKRYKNNFEVFIHFDGSYGVYHGSSLGVVLTLCFIEELLKFYNSNTVARIISSMTFTGSMDGEGRINSVSDEIIKAKTEAVFYSQAKLFVLPFEDYSAAKQKLDELKILYPKRSLELTPVANLEDILNRRNIVDIKKLTPVQRSTRFVKQNWTGILAAVVLTIFMTFLFALDLDDNPSTFSIDTNAVYIKNKNGKVLWKKEKTFNKVSLIDAKAIAGGVRILDINNDGENEVLVHLGIASATNFIDDGKLICYDKNADTVWIASLNDIVTSERETLSSQYSISMIDTITVKGVKSIYLISSNNHSFSSAIYHIDLKTGRRLPGTLWCSGHVVHAIVKDINNDGNKDILAIGLDNGYEDAVCFGYNIDTLTQVRFTTNEYLIKNFPIAELITYLRIPKTDFDIYFENRMPGLLGSLIKYDPRTNHYGFSTSAVYTETKHSIIEYIMDDNFIVEDAVISNNFRVRRDTLVAHGKLKPPFTDTEAYKEIIKNNILYFRNGKWVKREEAE